MESCLFASGCNTILLHDINGELYITIIGGEAGGKHTFTKFDMDDVDIIVTVIDRIRAKTGFPNDYNVFMDTVSKFKKQYGKTDEIAWRTETLERVGRGTN